MTGTTAIARTACALGALAAFAAGCAGSGEDGSTGGSFDASFSVQAALAELPRLTDDESLTIEMVDFVEAAAAVGIERLSADSTPDEIVDWAVAFVGTPVADGGTGVRVNPPELVGQRGISLAESIEPELGWTFGSITRFAEVSALPGRFTVLAGDVAWSPDLPEVTPGVQAIGDGEDGSLGDPTDLRPLGRPLRVAGRDGLAAASLQTEPISGWVAGTYDSYAENSSLAAAAKALDDGDVFQAALFRSSFSAVGAIPLDADQDQIDELFDQVVDQPFFTAATGVAAGDDGLRHVIAYVFATAESATLAAPQLETIWTTGTSTRNGEPFADLVGDVTITQDDTVVVVTGSVPDTESAGVVSQMIFSADLPFVHG